MTALLPALRETGGYWYLASPYTKYPGGTEAAFNEACRAAAWLMDNGVRIFCPIAHTHPLARYTQSPNTHEFWLAHDLPMLQASRGVIVAQMAGWQESYGVTWELEHNRQARRPVFYLRRDGSDYLISTTH